MSGRPLRFFALAVMGWTGVRVALLWPTIDAPSDLPRVILPVFALRDLPAVARSLAIDAVAAPGRKPAAERLRMPLPPSSLPVPGARRAPDPDRIALAMLGLLSVGPSQPVADAPPQVATPIPGALPPARSVGSRWSGSAWALLRDGGAAPPGLGGGQLGGGQVGLRVAYAIGAARRVAVVARVTSPLSGKGREASLGLEWRPGKAPVRLVAERRIALDRGKGGPAAGIIAGTGPEPLGGGFALESYGQAGVIRRDRTEPFADGAVRVTRPVAALGRTRIELGLGSWGGAQRDAARLDIGPTLGARLPIGDRAIRVSLDWRQRVAGRARPGSGIALTIGSDF